MLITLRLKESVNTIPELSRAISAFEAIDEVYRLMKAKDSIQPKSKIDFRTKPYRDVTGGGLEGFSVKSPPEITVNADNLWIAALVYILNNYSNVKKNIFEASEDLSQIGNALIGISQEDLQNAIIGAKLFGEALAQVGDENMKWLKKKLESASRVLRDENIESITKHED